MGSDGGSWSWPVVPWTLEPEICQTGTGGGQVFGEKCERGLGFFGEKSDLGEFEHSDHEWERKEKSDKYPGWEGVSNCKMFYQNFKRKIYYINLLRLI